jgi:TatA/E family protein of Tat protein translocase
MNFAGVGPAELLLILIVALVVFGPQRLPQIAKDLGKSIGKWRQAIDEIQSVVEVPTKEMKEILASEEKALQESIQQVVPLDQDAAGKSGDEPPASAEQADEPEENR